VQGIVILESIVDAEGCVSDVRVRKAVHPELNQASLTAVRQWVFRPAELRGKPVNVFFDLTLSFQLGDSPPAGGGAAAGGGKPGS
jgi:protein TonB